MNTTNSFKQIQEEDERMFPPPPDMEETIRGSLQILTIMGKTMELYLPKVFEMFVLTLGGTVREIDEAARAENPDGVPGVDPEGYTPGIAGMPPEE